MALRFRRSVKIAPGVHLNVGKKSASIRFGGKGFGITTGTAGTRVSAGIPGTGIYATQKLDGATGSRRSSAAASAVPQRTSMSLRDAAVQAGPAEGGFGFPGWWLTGAIVGVLGTLSGAYAALPFAALCGYMVWRRLSSTKYKALTSIRTASGNPSSEADDAVRTAASQAEDSWTVQRAAGLYFAMREQPGQAVSYLGKALGMFPGDKRALASATADAAIDADQLDYAIAVLEPFLAAAAPDEDDLDAVLISMLGLALQKKGDPTRALEVVNRLPLRRRNLSQALLLGLCVRGLAKHAMGKKADAERDMDRVYAADPGFPFLSEARAMMAASAPAS